MREPRIRENPTIKEILDHVRYFTWLRRAMPLLRPLLRRFSVDVRGIDEALANSSDLVRASHELAVIPDRFNEIFSERGWIIYDRMDLTIAQSAIQIAERESLESAEAFLVEYYDAEIVRQGVQSMFAVEAFRPRLALAEKAVVDYAEERFHACIPVVLALLDGMVNEVHQKAHGQRRGISAEGVNLVAWDSFAAHNSGLMRLVKIFQTGRRRTTTEPLSLPYRNGIMHGIDLGYDNRLVAAKTWVALFAAREWAIKAERHAVNPPPSPRPLTVRESWAELKESITRWRRLQEHKRWSEEWKPRQILSAAPNTSLGEFQAGTPEHALDEFLTLWHAGNFGRMAQLIAMFQGEGAKRGPAQVRRVFGKKKLSSYAIVQVRDETFAITEIETGIEYIQEGSPFTERHVVRMLYTGLDGLPALFGYSAGRWCVMNWTFDGDRTIAAAAGNEDLNDSPDA
jgi:hypothetical protein